MAATAPLPPVTFLLGDERHGRPPAGNLVEGWTASPDGVRVHTSKWLVPNPRALVVFVHGFGHWLGDELFMRLAAELNARGIACCGVDHVAHGRSDGLKMYIPRFRDLSETLVAFAGEVAAELPVGTPVFLHGESMGGAIALTMLKDAPANLFRGAVLLAPMCGIAPGTEPPGAVVAVLKLFNRCFPKAAMVPVDDPLPRCFADPAAEPHARAPEHVYRGRMRLGTGLSLKNAMEELQADMAFLRHSCAIFQGSGDRVTDPAMARRLFDSCTSQDATFFEYEGAEHALYWEPQSTRRQMLDDVAGWILERCDPKDAPAPGKHVITRSKGSGGFMATEVGLAAVGGGGAAAEGAGAAEAEEKKE